MTRSALEYAMSAGLAASRQFAGVSVVYGRGETSFSISNAVEGTLRYGTLADSGSDTIVELVDWLIDASAMALGDPLVGDTITRSLDGVSHVYSVEQMDMGLHHWDWSDTGRTQYRIRTRKLTKTVSTPNGYDISGNEIRYE